MIGTECTMIWERIASFWTNCINIQKMLTSVQSTYVHVLLMLQKQFSLFLSPSSAMSRFSFNIFLWLCPSAWPLSKIWTPFMDSPITCSLRYIENRPFLFAPTDFELCFWIIFIDRSKNRFLTETWENTKIVATNLCQHILYPKCPSVNVASVYV